MEDDTSRRRPTSSAHRHDELQSGPVFPIADIIVGGIMAYCPDAAMHTHADVTFPGLVASCY